MNFEKPPEQENVPSEYERLVQAELETSDSANEGEAAKRVELVLFEERIGQFEEADLVPDADGSWDGFEQKVRDVYPEVPESRFKAMKAGVTKHLCGL